jgi:hypothetical protein
VVVESNAAERDVMAKTQETSSVMGLVSSGYQGTHQGTPTPSHFDLTKTQFIINVRYVVYTKSALQ